MNVAINIDPFTLGPLINAYFSGVLSEGEGLIVRKDKGIIVFDMPLNNETLQQAYDRAMKGI